MKYIAHRGNTHGPKPELENSPDYIDKAIEHGFDVEIDIWYVDEVFYLGHDEPQYKIDIKYILDRYARLWCHCKNLQALDQLLPYRLLNVFVHDKDMATLTSQNHVWTYPGSTYYTRNSICVMPEWEATCDVSDWKPELTFINCETLPYGVCSDFVKYLRGDKK